jgi:uncharacterized cupredoxin-like copper-binding protein
MFHRLLAVVSLGLLVAGLLLTACGKPSPISSADHGLPVQLTLTDFHIASSVTTFMAGRAYHFVVVNRGQTTHELMIMPSDLGAMNGMPMAAMDHMALADVVDFPPDQTRVLNYRFPVTMAGSHPEFACYDPSHYELGMHLAVAVSA